MANREEEIYEKLKGEIINLDLVPGTKIREEDLVNRFHISRTPIRAVILRLELDGFLIVAPKRGTYVSKMDAKQINDSLFIRKAVEATVLTSLMDTITEDQIKELEDLLQKQEEIVLMEPSIEKSKLFFHNDNLFHATLFRFMNLEGVWKEIHTNQNNLNRVRIMANLRETNKVEKVYAQHVQILEGLKEKNLDKTLEAFKAHIDGGFDGIDNVIKKYKDYFI